MNEKDVAQLVGVSVKTVRGWRFRNVGPNFFRAGSCVRYWRGDVQAWIEANTVQTRANGAAR